MEVGGEEAEASMGGRLDLILSSGDADGVVRRRPQARVGRTGEGGKATGEGEWSGRLGWAKAQGRHGGAVGRPAGRLGLPSG